MRTHLGLFSVIVISGLFWGATAAAQTEQPVYKDRARAISAYYNDGVTSVSVDMSAYMIESVGVEVWFASVYKTDLASGASDSCVTDNDKYISLTVSQSGHAEGRLTPSQDTCANLAAPVIVTCRASAATVTMMGTTIYKYRGPFDEAYAKKYQGKDWVFDALSCSIVAFGAEYQTDIGHAYFGQMVVIP